MPANALAAALVPHDHAARVWILERRYGPERMHRLREGGKLRGGVDPMAALSVLSGPLYAPRLLGGEVPTVAAVQAYGDNACSAVFSR